VELVLEGNEGVISLLCEFDVSQDRPRDIRSNFCSLHPHSQNLNPGFHPELVRFNR